MKCIDFNDIFGNIMSKVVGFLFNILVVFRNDFN